MRELLPCRPGVLVIADDSMLALRTLRGRLSLLPPQTDDGARALTEASVSIERRRLLLLEEASVKIEALSVSRPFAVAALYVFGTPVGAKCDGIADAGDVVGGNGWLNWMDWVLLWLLPEGPALFGDTDCIVVRVVVNDRTDGAGLLKVLSSPLLESNPPPAVLLVPAKELAPWLGAAELMAS